MKKLIAIVLIAILVVLCVVFAVSSSGQIVSVKFPGVRLESEFWMFAISSSFIGVLIGYLLASIGTMKHKVKARGLNKKLLKAEKEVSNLRNIPIKEDI